MAILLAKMRWNSARKTELEPERSPDANCCA